MLIYKICTADEWSGFQACGNFAGSPDDLRDGYIHLSGADQVARTAARFFAGRADLVLLGVEAVHLGDNLRWERSNSGAQYPHFYGLLPLDSIVSTARLDIGPDGRHILPPGLE
jgi:uncharacterized protein (DUF952 family)